ncbi:Glutathione S-transferase N-terminal [Penicillium brevicompactum]|uniref:Glutathione S-transferase N-terminal n=1 Tax=Penicillium brevicompactum TaxID=5074 RepID=A0A9W9R344_PENBR|nr:Glutathione S-transferase N-terminal [Penicillium brevicompactum]
MTVSHYTLFDIPSGKAPSVTWTPNPWKTRLLLNFKGLDHQTQWSMKVEYPDIKPTLESHVAPNEKGMPYSIPTIASPDGTYVMDSRKIANYIESKHPLPSLHLDSVYLEKVERLWSQYMGAIMPIFLPRVPKQVLNQESVPYWNKTREEWIGMSLDQLSQEKGGQKAWNQAEPILREVTALLKENEGPFFLGDTPSYADLTWGSIILFHQALGQDVFDEALKRGGDAQVHLDLLKAIQPWV